MTGTLPWDDPDVAAADMAAVYERIRTHGHQEPWHASVVIASAERHTHQMSPCMIEPVTSRPRPDLTRRQPWHGGRITAADLDVDQDRIGAAFEAGLRAGPPSRHLRTRDDVMRFRATDDRIAHNVNRGMRKDLAAALAALPPFDYDYDSDVYDPRWNEPQRVEEATDREDSSRRYFLNDTTTRRSRHRDGAEPFLELAEKLTDETAERTGVPPGLLDYRRWASGAYTSGFDRERLGIWPSLKF